LFIFSIFNQYSLTAKEELRFLSYKAKNGDNLKTVFQKFKLEYNETNINKLKTLNKKKFTKNLGFMIGVNYELPIVITETMANDNDVINYNKSLEKKGVRYKIKKTSLYVPYDIYLSKKKVINSDTIAVKSPKVKKEDSNSEENSESKSDVSDKEGLLEKTLTEKLFGKSYSKVKILDSKLKGRVFYLDPGHGGPDPGAIGELNGNKICEDEYAYDVTLRLAYFLMQHKAKVYVLVHDHDDGIRDEQYLKLDNDEVYLDGEKINQKQKTRLQQRVDIVNKLYKKNQKKYNSQDMLVIHLDSRENDQRIDIFFYFQEDKIESKELADNLYKTIEEKYDKYQPGRGYKGSVTTRNLFMLNNSKPNSVYIELGNIKNKNDQMRFIQRNNRQAIANWLCDGILENYRTTQKNTKK
jgi:N-acetylmuramoyl-L-alanine amidase